MRRKYFLQIIAIIAALSGCGATKTETDNLITISGRVTDFKGDPIGNALVELKHGDFSAAYSAYSDESGNYSLNNIKKGRYLGLYVLRPEEYPKEQAVPPEQMRLEYWAWNLIADKNIIINPRYHRLELYGLTAFKIEGANPGLMLYVRPMSLGKILDTMNAGELDSRVYPEHFRIKVFVDEQPAKVNSIQSVEEFISQSESIPLLGYLIHIEMNSKSNEKYRIIRVVGENLEYNEMGESVYFYEPHYYE